MQWCCVSLILYCFIIFSPLNFFCFVRSVFAQYIDDRALQSITFFIKLHSLFHIKILQLSISFCYVLESQVTITNS